MRYMTLLVVLCFAVGCRDSEPDAGKGAETDILNYRAEHPHMNSTIHYPDGSTYRPRYGDMKLEKAEKLLSTKYERPWTVPKVIEWYRDAEQPKTRAALLSLLAASQDERAVPIIGAALDDSMLEVRVAATYGILDYFMETGVEGGTEQHVMAAHKWWVQWKSKQEK